jgi:predicted transposase/invertase (TIGR01784 family)
MKTDKLFYRLFISQPRLIAELIPEIPKDCEFSYSAPVVKEQGFALDGLLTPIRDDLSLPLIFLEAQMQRDTRFYGRYFAEIFLYLHQYEVKRPWYGLLILQNRNYDLGVDIPYETLLVDRVKRLYLEDLLLLKYLSPNLALLKLLVADEGETVTLAQSIINSAETEEEFQQRLDLVEAILVNKFPQLSTEEILKMLNLKTADVTQTKFYQEVFQVGQQEGRQEGREQGQYEEAVALVLRQLNRRCGVLSISLEEQVRSLAISEVEMLGEGLLDFTGVTDLEAWLLVLKPQ